MFICVNGKLLRVCAVLLALVILFGVLVHFYSGRRVSVPAMAVGGREVTVIIDPGHGGADGGAVSPSGIVESEINLQISKKLEAILMLFGVSVVMTRESNDIDYPADATTIRAKKQADTRARVSLIESFDNALLISIHQNKYPNAGPFGAQAIYANTSGSQELAEAIQDNFLLFLDPTSRRTATKVSDDIYIMNHISCPAVLVECGFLSNPSDEANLCSNDYQIKLSAVLASTILCAGG